MSKASLVLLVMLPFLTFSQNCDTLYSHEKYIERIADVRFHNCYWAHIDTIYRIVQWNNYDETTQTQYRIKSGCFSLFHSKTGVLLEEFWKQNDTVYAKTYYETGSLKSYSAQFHDRANGYFYETFDKYYESGNLYERNITEHLKFHERFQYYPTGALLTKGVYFNGNFSPWGEYVEYYPNGQPSAVRCYSMPDTLLETYQSSTLLSEQFYKMTGEEIDTTLNRFNSYSNAIYPPRDDHWMKITDSLFTHHQFQNQLAYENDMSSFKKRLLEELSLPDSCNCRAGAFWLSFIVDKLGNIQIVDWELEDEILRRSLEKAIGKIKNWPPGTIDGESVDTYVFTLLILNPS